MSVNIIADVIQLHVSMRGTTSYPGFSLYARTRGTRKSLGTRLCSASSHRGKSLGTRLCEAMILFLFSLICRLPSDKTTRTKNVLRAFCCVVRYFNSLAPRILCAPQKSPHFRNHAVLPETFFSGLYYINLYNQLKSQKYYKHRTNL